MEAAQRERLKAALTRLKRGDRAAGDEVFRLAWPAMRAFAARWVQGSPHAEDVAQRALVRLFEQAIAFDERRDALAWALELTVWECRTERARLRRARVDGPPPEQLETADARPDVAFEKAELASALTEALAGLPEGDRDELGRLLEGAAAGDAASRKRRQRALERLRQLWRTMHGD